MCEWNKLANKYEMETYFLRNKKNNINVKFLILLCYYFIFVYLPSPLNVIIAGSVSLVLILVSFLIALKSILSVLFKVFSISIFSFQFINLKRHE
jgi:hypothetical protein